MTEEPAAETVEQVAEQAEAPGDPVDVVAWLSVFCRALRPEIPRGAQVKRAVGAMRENLPAAAADGFAAPQMAAASELLAALDSDEAADVVRQSVEHQLANRLGAHPFGECPSSRFRLQPSQFSRVVESIASLIVSWR